MAASAPLSIDCAGRPTRAINEEIRRAADDGVPVVELLNPQARHNLGVSVLKPIHIVFRGHVGSYTVGLCDGVSAEVHGTAGWGVADNLMSGEVVVHGKRRHLGGALHPRRARRRARRCGAALGHDPEEGRAHHRR